MLARGRTVSLPKSIEDVRQKLLAYPTARIRNTHLHRSAYARNLHTNAPAPVSKLHRIRQQTPNHLLKPVSIAGNHRRRRVEILLDLDALCLSSRTNYIDRILDDRHHFQWMQIEIKIAGDDARHVENVVDDLRLRFCVAPDHFNCLL